ncbi:protein D2-like [Sitophilus oryzae]|uniref:Protein D2-like n=1 Tax=Sitophilus oryzae TaxID=7048 RepID=A0A6J2XNL5_SITOR|nr:protein D2-like [Sitophilus oryzae]XP_030752461.1 protein D2-like [Sitophilus oryzae]XP_030752463.1 protein D2-like [Sitophilus oryzae]
MDTNNIVPDTLDHVPSAKITVIYPGNKEVIFGGELTPTDVLEQPQISWEADPEKLYTLLMVDPDAPSRENPTFREINHWLVINIKGNDIATGQTLTSYRGSRPPKGYGLHRYIFIVHEQNGPITVNEPDLENNRRNFSARAFAKKYNLGLPYAGNYYQAQWDSSVPLVR